MANSGSWVSGSFPSSGKSLFFCNSRRFNKGSPLHRVTFSMGHAGASRNTPNDSPLGKLSRMDSEGQFLRHSWLLLSLGHMKLPYCSSSASNHLCWFLFQGSVGGLTMAEGQQYARINITIIDDDHPEDDSYFLLRLVNPSGGAQLGIGSLVRIIIENSDDAYGVLQFDSLSTTKLISEDPIANRNISLTVSHTPLVWRPARLPDIPPTAHHTGRLKNREPAPSTACPPAHPTACSPIRLPTRRSLAPPWSANTCRMNLPLGSCTVLFSWEINELDGCNTSHWHFSLRLAVWQTIACLNLK